MLRTQTKHIWAQFVYKQCLGLLKFLSMIYSRSLTSRMAAYTSNKKGEWQPL